MQQDIKVRLGWQVGRNTDSQWNEICIWVLEQFGNPGERYTWHPHGDYMEFRFKKESDAVHLMLRWS